MKPFRPSLFLLNAAAFLATCLGAIAAPAATDAPYPLATKEVIAFTGGSNIERTRFNGHLQTMIFASHPTNQLRIRNLGWEGDTVFELWRDNVSKEQWNRPRDWRQQLAEVGAKVVFAQFGQMESLGGDAKLQSFVDAYEKLLADFAFDGRRVVLLSPMPFERTSSKLVPELSLRNDDVKRYADAIRQLAKRKGYRYVDLFTPLSARGTKEPRLTDNGYQLTDTGHKIVADLIGRDLGFTQEKQIKSENIRGAVMEMERLWFNTWRPMNWSFLAGDRTHVPFSRDWTNPEQRLFPDEMKEYATLLEKADQNIWRAMEGKPLEALSVADVIPPGVPKIASQSPDQELASMKIRPEFQVNLFASETDGIVKPIQMRWDERGRLWVACTVSYPQIKPGEKANDYIMVCEDTDGDGRADKFTKFAEGLFMPTGLELGNGGVYVAQGTELLFLRDTDGDGKADERRVLLGGFGTADSHQMINCISWGFGGELWFTQGHHIYSRVETPYGVERLNRAGVWRFNPRTMRLDPFFQMSSAGANCWGVLTDDYGQAFHKSGANVGAYYTVPGMIRSELPLNAESMRMFLARAKQVGFEQIGTKHFPAEMQGLFVIGGYYDNTLQLHKMSYTNGLFSTVQMTPIIETTNTVFRPVDVHTGPDGAIYFADWYNPIIGHYQASYRDPDRDKGHGRIWRVTYKDRELVKLTKQTGASIESLLGQMGSGERLVKYQAKRLLFEKDSAQVVAALDRWVKKLNQSKPDEEYLLLQALSVYEAHETVRPKLLEALLGSKDERVRSYATRVIGHWQDRLPDALALLTKRVSDPHPRVRLEAVVASSYVNNPAAVAVATRVLDLPMDTYLDHALIKMVNVSRPQWEPLVSTGKLPFQKDEHLMFVLRKESLTNAPALLRDRLAGAKGNTARTLQILTTLVSIGGPEDLRFAFEQSKGNVDLLNAIADESSIRKLVPEGDITALLDPLLKQVDAARQTAAVRLSGVWGAKDLIAPIEAIARNETAALSLRKEAFLTLATLQGRGAIPILSGAANGAKNDDVGLAAIDAATRVDLKTAAELTAAKLSKSANAATAGRWLKPLLARSKGGDVLATVLAAKPLSTEAARLSIGALAAMGRGDKALLTQLNKQAGFSENVPAYEPEFIKQLAAAAMATGNAAEGKKHFQVLGCATCHKIESEGGNIGPELSALGRGLPIEGIITELLWPQVNVKEGYTSTTVTTKDGRTIEGILQSDTADEIAVKDLLTGEIVRIRRTQTATFRTGGSAMPEGLTSALDRKQLEDLVRYLASLGKN
ncbi:MAG TPA: PVC-type heme-binding CxxCH protein [Roseimicrobium sp.]|nr:PVC-type heme-binding CxxCH protein [Roseimicrobium sp.]